ncbi:MAG: FTR1 family protein [Firmicutes bacterium]|nr:FTR1 family protein [Bacillota bacterium]
MQDFLPGLIIGFREGMEAFLIVAVILRYLKKTNREESTKYVWRGAFVGVILSLILGGVLYAISNSFDSVGPVSKLWETSASLFALVLVTTFIIWMIKNGSSMTGDIQAKLHQDISKTGIFVLAFAMIAREGVEIAIFSFAGSYSILGIFAGVLLSLVFVVMIFYSLVKVNLKMIFNITLVYLILQAGFLLGYGIHEGLSAFKDLSLIESSHPVFTKFFDLSSTIFDHKTGILGVPLYVGFGWYSKPEIIQFVIQYVYTFSILGFWLYTLKKQK